ncbi:MAG: hypothetical protein K0S32_2126 [Bacteroidetes bacterium]|jgi:uncharacterized protein (DUF885 family)|nr:hypothetical protein [Bacteroidota bacterium]
MKREIIILIMLAVNGIFFAQSSSKTTGIDKLYSAFMKEYETLNIPDTDLDYTVNFSRIQSVTELEKQEKFFQKYKNDLSRIDFLILNAEQKIKHKHLAYQVARNLERISLEKNWNGNKITSPKGLFGLPHGKKWYEYYVKHFTGVNIHPDDVFKYGESEVKRVQEELKNIQSKLGYKNQEEFYSDLKTEKFYLNSKDEVLLSYKRTDSIVRKNLYKLFNIANVPAIEAMEWPDANAFTPPGIYLNKANNPYGVDVFQFNFFNKRHNKRSIEWLYMHEAIPGHHLQSITNQNNPLANNFFYFGTTEGWACYIERFGKDLGLYKSEFSYLGLCEWDLVRSARLVMEVGIHYYGWDYEKTLAYWKENIKGQDEIAEREITRITKWPGQSLCYKIGAWKIERIVEDKIKQGQSIKDAHGFILNHTDFPLESLATN